MSDQHPAKKRPSGLGRGLSALLGDAPPAEAPVVAGRSGEGIQRIAIGDIAPNPDQPRRRFAEEEIANLAASIAEHGIIQPIIVRPAPQGRGYQIVAGERRWRAAQRARLHEMPVLVRTLQDAETYEIALIENIQRQDLNAIEEAQGYARLRDVYGHDAEAMARIVGKSRAHVANMIRLLDLDAAVQQLVVDGSLSMGHARTLIGVANAPALAHQMIADGLSVRGAEKLVRSHGGKSRPRKAAATKTGDSGDADIRSLESHLGDLLGLSVRITHHGDGSGDLTLHYASLDQLDMICQRLTGDADL